MTTNKEITTTSKQPMALHSDVPEWMRSEVGKAKGMEKVEQSDILLPRLGLAQALSPELRKSDSKYIPELKAGQMFNTVTREIYGESIEIIPLFFFKNRIKYFPIEEGGGIECISINGIDGGTISPVGCASCRFSVWGNGMNTPESSGDAPLCTMYHNFMSFTIEDPMPIAISYKATGLKLSKQLLAGIRLTRLPMYAKIYKIEVTTLRSGQNEWFEKKLSPVNWTPKDLFQQMEANFEALQKLSIQVDTTGEDEDISFPGSESEAEKKMEI